MTKSEIERETVREGFDEDRDIKYGQSYKRKRERGSGRETKR